MAENIKEQLLEIIQNCKAKYSSPESIAALQKTFQSHNITIEDWNSLIEYVKTAIDTGNDLIEVIDLVGDYVIQTVEDKMEEVDDTLALKVDKTTTVNGHSLSTDINLSKNDIGLGNADNTSDVNKPISTATQAALDLKADKEGPLPSFAVSGNDNIVDFITNNHVNNEPLIIKIDNHPYIGVFHYYASGVNALSFELEIFDNLDEGTIRYAATAIEDADTKKFSDILVSANLNNYELKKNKVTTLTSSSSNTQYPSAKAVWDNLQNIREVAEGKTKSYILSYTDTVSTSSHYSNYEYYDPTDKCFHNFENQTQFNNWISNTPVKNDIFNNSADLIGPGPGIAGILIFRKIYEKTFSLIRITDAFRDNTTVGIAAEAFFKKGDVILIMQTGVPDRWYGGYYDAAHGGIMPFYVLDAKTDLTSYRTAAQEDALLAQKQDTLVSGTNIKTIHGQSVLGSGNIVLFEEASDEDIENVMEDDEND